MRILFHAAPGGRTTTVLSRAANVQEEGRLLQLRGRKLRKIRERDREANVQLIRITVPDQRTGLRNKNQNLVKINSKKSGTLSL